MVLYLAIVKPLCFQAKPICFPSALTNLLISGILDPDAYALGTLLPLLITQIPVL